MDKQKETAFKKKKTLDERDGIWYNKHPLNATVAQQVEQLTRNEQVVRSNRIGSSSGKLPLPRCAPHVCGVRFVLPPLLWREWPPAVMETSFAYNGDLPV